MAGNFNIKNANGKTLTIQNPDTNNADIVIDGSKIASTVSPTFTGTPTAPTPTVGDNSIKIATTAFANSLAIGVNQTLQTFTVGTQRISGTTYTNSTGKPIEIYIVGSSGGGGWNITLTINSMQVLSMGVTSNQGESMCFSSIIPNGATYVVNNSGASIFSWKELR